jgi:branched-subunit amino acid permease
MKPSVFLEQLGHFPTPVMKVIIIIIISHSMVQYLGAYNN